MRGRSENLRKGLTGQTLLELEHFILNLKEKVLTFAGNIMGECLNLLPFVLKKVGNFRESLKDLFCLKIYKKTFSS